MVALSIVIGQGDALGWLNPTVIGLALVFVIASTRWPRPWARRSAAIALLFNVLMVVVAIIAIALTVPRDDPGVGR